MRILTIIIFLLIFAIGFLQWGTYGTGEKSGVVMTISKKGILFKTHEGQLNLQGFGAVEDNNQFSEVWKFSVINNSKLIEKLEKASLQGKRVELKFHEKYITLPWRGTTKYLVYDIVFDN